MLKPPYDKIPEQFANGKLGPPNIDYLGTVQELYEAQPGGPTMLTYPAWRIRAAVMRAAVHQLSLEKCQLEELMARHVKAVETQIHKARVREARKFAAPFIDVPTPHPIQ